MGDYDVGDVDTAMQLSSEKSPAELDMMATSQHRKDRWRWVVVYMGVISMGVGLSLPDRLFTTHPFLLIAVLLMGAVGIALFLLDGLESRKAKRIALARHFARKRGVGDPRSSV